MAIEQGLAEVAKELPSHLARQQARLSRLLREVRQLPLEPEVQDRLAVRSRGRVLFVRVIDIDWIGSDDNYVSLHANGTAYRMRETMQSLERRLPRECFLRISRTAIVNIERVQELKRTRRGVRNVVLQDGTSMPVSRGYKSSLDRLGVGRKRRVPQATSVPG